MVLVTIARWLALTAFACFVATVSAFNNDRSDNLAVYWGQDSGGNQQRLSFYCDDDTIDAIPIAFLYVFFGKGGAPMIDLANTCSLGGGSTFRGTNLADCSFLASDIRTCQSKGKIVTISLGGATGKVGFSSDAQAQGFAQQIWDMFLGGGGCSSPFSEAPRANNCEMPSITDSNMRPFGNAVLDGVDLDIESGSAAHYAAFVNRLRSLSRGASKRYYITAAPQCPFPDEAVGAALNGAPFDAVYVQFYNNFCESSSPSQFNFATWDNWARKTSPNPNVKVYIGAPAADYAAGDGFVDINTLSRIAKDAQRKYSTFGGVMLWDASVARKNNRFDRAIKQALVNGQPPRPVGPAPAPVTHNPTPAATHAPGPAAPPAPHTATTPRAPQTTSTLLHEPTIRRPAPARVMPQSVIHPNLNSRFFKKNINN
ncbi:hypothetical protein HGRIS_007581 [Hohenbuehelia grisea]|uniref:chitinase n=1 Tax=Hohenbuehelia grisea TaxID=104357 RepID=A0ABR3J5G4_9AGAR